MTMRKTIAMTCAVLALAGGVAAADDETEGDAKAAKKAKKQPAPADKEAEKAEKAEKKRTGDTLEVTGRVFARMTASSEDSAAWQSDLGLASARIGVDYQWREKLRAELSYEAAKSSLRDAYVQLELGHGFRIRAGRFKLPIGTVEQTAAWTLPTIDRGMTADILNDGIAVTGRRSAVGLRWRQPGPWRPTVEVAVAQRTGLIDGDQDALLSDQAGLTVVARAEVQACEMYTVAIAGSSRSLDYGNAVERFRTGSVELEIDLAPAGYGLRLWADAMVGESHLGDRRFGDPIMAFAAGHAIAGYRVGGDDRSDSYVEPYLGVGWFNPVLDHARDDVTEVVVGVAGGLWKRWRIHGQVAYQNAKAERPAGLRADQDVNDKLTVTTQLGAGF